MAWLPMFLPAMQIAEVISDKKWESFVESDGTVLSGAVIKATDTSDVIINMSSDSSGSTTFTSITINSSGRPERLASLVTLYIDQDYKLILYPSQSDADANTNALWTTGNIVFDLGLSDTSDVEKADEQIGVKRTDANAAAFTEHDYHEKRTISPELDFLAVGDGTTDDLTPLTRFFTALLANKNLKGQFLSTTYAISAALPDINVSGFELRGFGPSASHDVGSFSGTIIKKIGAASGDMLTIAPTEGASAQGLAGVKIIGVGFDCNSLAAKGLVIKSVRNSDIDIFVANATSTGFELDVATTLGESTDTQRNRIRYTGRQVESASGVSLRLKGTATANPSFNWFEVIDVVHKNAAGIIEENADNNVWGSVRVTRASGGTATNSIEWQGGDTEPESCRSEQFLSLSATVAPIAKGTGTYTVGAANIIVRTLDKANSTPDITVETGATAYWANDNTPIYDETWITYTPTVTSTTGTITTVGAVSGRYKQTALLVFWKVSVTITTNGTGAGKVRITLPSAPGNVKNGNYYATGRGNAVSGKQLLGSIINGQQYVDVQNYDDTYPGADAETLILSGFYEVS